MKAISKVYTLFAVLLTISNYSCEKAPSDKMIIEGYIIDHVSKLPIDGVTIYVDAVKTSTGMGIITDGNREHVGDVITDSRGYYRLTLKVFEKAERLECSLNTGFKKNGYAEDKINKNLAELNRHGRNDLNFELSPTEILKIHFKNSLPFSDDDSFNYSYVDWGEGWTRGTLKKENCGTVEINKYFRWVGKDVCGIHSIETLAGEFTRIYWFVIKKGISKEFKDSVYVKKGGPNDFFINY